MARLLSESDCLLVGFRLALERVTVTKKVNIR